MNLYEVLWPGFPYSYSSSAVWVELYFCTTQAKRSLCQIQQKEREVRPDRSYTDSCHLDPPPAVMSLSSQSSASYFTSVRSFCPSFYWLISFYGMNRGKSDGGHYPICWRISLLCGLSWPVFILYFAA